MMTLDILLKVYCYIVLQKVVQACDSSLIPTKVSAVMDFADTLDDVNNNISYAVLDDNRAFCVDSRNGFFMQIEFASVRKVTKLRTEGFNLNGTYYSLHAYSLEFSFDNISWYKYNDGNANSPQFFLVQPKSFTNKGSFGNIVDHKLSGIGKFVRIVPYWSGNMSKQPFCIKFHVRGCERVSSPLVSVGPSEQAKINQPTVLTCNASGTVGLVVAWKTFSYTQNRQKAGVYLNGYTVTSSLTLNIQFKDLDSYTCVQTSSRVTCSRKFTCKSFYYFNKRTKTEMNKFVKVIIEFPVPVQNLFVSNKTESEIQLKWNLPSRNDVPAEMLRYRLACNLTGRLIEEYLPFTHISRTLSNLGVYAPCKCSLVLVVANDTEEFPFNINHDPVVLYFRSRSLRPNVTPIITASAISPYSIKVTFMTEIKVYNEGVLQGHKIDATMMKYGNRILQENLFRKRHFIKNVTNPKQNEVVLDGLKPWAYYNVSVVAFNQDGLYSNHSFKHIATPEGTPDIGPSLTLVTRTSKSISIQVDLNAFPFFKHNGKIIMYKILVLPDKREENFHRLQFEVMGLLPNTEYMFQCKGSTSFGYGPYGTLLKAKTAEGKPSEPRNVYVEQSNSRHMLYVSWIKPLHPNGKITQYEIQYIRKDGKPKSVMKAPDQTSRIELIDNDGEIASVMVRAFTKEGDGEWSKHVQVNPRTSNQNSLQNSFNIQLLIILFVSLAVSLSAVGTGCCCYFRRPCRSSNRTRQQKLVHGFEEEPLCSPKHSIYSPLQSLKKTYTSNRSGNMDGEEAMLEEEKAWISKTGYDQSGFESEHKPILKEEFLNYVNSVKKYDHEILANQFKKIPSGKQYSWDVAEKLDNQSKNRYRKVYPYDHSRVILHFDCKRKTADYINASLIHGFNHLHDSNIYYVSTQGPMPNTYNDFWHMIWQESITVIVMVTNLKENEMEKCNQYWPSNGHIKYGGIIVALDKIDKTADYITRTFQVEKVNTKEVRSIRQFQFVSWPDHGVPDYPTALLSLRRHMRHYWKEGRPILVHCSAGIGRSGCFILIDAMLEQIDQQGTVDVYSYFKYLRTRRINMVQNAEQYIFAHNAILEYITFGNTEILVDELDRKTRELSRGTGMTKEFALLSRNTDQSDSSNIHKVLLLQGKHMDAFLVDGYKQRDAFILTKVPDQKNVADFWKMVIERQCHTIVMLNKLQEPSQEYLRYWPDVEGHASYRDVTVLMSSEVANGNIITRKIKVTTSKSRCEAHHFQYVDWPDADVPNKRAYSNICTLMQAVEKSQQTLGNGPIIVHAGNDFGRSGTFIAIYNSTERLKVEQIINVLQCVRAIRIAQPLAVDNVAQYQFVYNMLRTYLEGFENYYNYIDYKTCRSLSSTSTM